MATANKRYSVRVDVSFQDNFQGGQIRFAQDWQLNVQDFSEIAEVMQAFHNLAQSLRRDDDSENKDT